MDPDRRDFGNGGSKDYFDTKNEGNFNTALANRQPGSSLKPIMYATAFEKDIRLQLW